MNRLFASAALGAGLGLVILMGCSSSSSNGGGTNQPDSSTPPPPPPAPNPNPPPPPPPPPPAPPGDSGADVDINAPEVTINYMATCPDIIPCDVDPSGTWTLASGCIDSSIFAQAKQSCAGLMESGVTIKAKGISTITATTVSQKSQSDFKASLYLPTACVEGNGLTCTFVTAALKTAQFGAFDTANCKAHVGGGCDCDVEKVTVLSTTDTYTRAGGVLTTTGGDKFDYCVEPANTLTTRQQNKDGSKGPATFTATK
jgi:hypothetical protein